MRRVALLGAAACIAGACTTNTSKLSVPGGSGGGSGGQGSTPTATGSVPTSTTSSSGPTVLAQSFNEQAVSKVDLLIAVDNSSSMADKQLILAQSLPVLVDRLVNPWCVQDKADGGIAFQSPPQPPCAAGYVQQFKPIADMHIGIVSTSLGGHGSDACPTTAGSCTDLDNPSNNDMGHLVFRKSAAITSGACNTADIQPGTVTTTGNLGFLAWDPGSQYTYAPPSYQNSTALLNDLGAMLSGVGEIGCGFESQSESWYRFLIEPEPWTSLTVDENSGSKTYRQAIKSGTDYALLQQRAQFLRPDSLVVIVALSDENDASFQEGGNYWYASKEESGGQAFHLPAATSICATDPTNACCQSCAEATATGCVADPACKQGGNIAYLTDNTDDANLRAWDDKRRFGIDFLYPIERYRSGLQDMTVIGSQSGQAVPNPLYTRISEPAGYKAATGKDWIPQAAGTLRTPADQTVLLASITGVPWQDIARDPTDLSQGFKDSAEMSIPIDAAGHTTWDVVLGKPITDSSSAYVKNTRNYVPPLDPHMIESTVPRTTLPGISQNPLFASPLVAPTTAEGGDPINGHEYTVNFAAGQRTTMFKDLQYACIFELPTPRDCTGVGTDCDCTDGTTDRPLCVAAPGSTNPAIHTYQKYAKAYPGIRELSLLKQLGSQGIVGSICPKQLTDPTALDYGYTMVANGIVNRLKSRLGGQCLPTSIPIQPNGGTQCTVLEVAPNTGAACNCNGSGRSQPSVLSVVALETNPGFRSVCGQNSASCCVCEITPLVDPSGPFSPAQCDAANGTYGSALHTCECNTADDQTLTGAADGWCYVDPSQNVGATALVRACPNSETQRIRFAGNSYPKGQTYITCQP